MLGDSHPLLPCLDSPQNHKILLASFSTLNTPTNEPNNNPMVLFTYLIYSC